MTINNKAAMCPKHKLLAYQEFGVLHIGIMYSAATFLCCYKFPLLFTIHNTDIDSGKRKRSMKIVMSKSAFEKISVYLHYV